MRIFLLFHIKFLANFAKKNYQKSLLNLNLQMF